MPPANYLPSEDQTQDPHVRRAIDQAWDWRRRMEAGQFSKLRDLAIAVGLAERHVSLQLRLGHLAPEVLKRLVYVREGARGDGSRPEQLRRAAWGTAGGGGV